MNITWKGQSCFQISASQVKNGSVSIVIDPFSKEIGLRVPKLQADILLVTHDHSDHNNIKAVSGDPFIIDSPGEYDIKGVFVQGISASHGGEEETSIYILETEGLRLCHLGDLHQKELSPEQLEKIGNVDILMIPIGGTYTIDAKEAIKIMSQIEPKIIIPMHYKIGKLNIKLDGLDKFLKVLGIKSLQSLDKLSVKKKDLSGEEVKIITLNP